MEEARTLDFIRSVGAGHLLTTADGRIDSTFVPFALENHGDSLIVRAHLNKANPHHRLLDGANGLLIVSGPDAYVSPANYPTKSEGGNVVPTWNYAIAHIRGSISTFDDRDSLLRDVSALSDLHEASQHHPWSVEDAPVDYINNLLKRIIGLEMRVDSIEGKAKLSQNRPEIDRSTVRDSFLGGSPRERQVGELMKDR